MCAHHIHIPGVLRDQKKTGFPRTGVTYSCGALTLCRCWELNLGPLLEHPGF